jgi:hypothetical protein
MLRSYLLTVGVSAAALGFSVAGCGGSTDTTPMGGGGNDSSSSGSKGSSGSGAVMPGVHAEPPKPPAATAPDGATDGTFAIKKLYLGDTKRDGTPDKTNGWKQFGFDLDGKISTADSTDLCKPRSNALPKNVYPDGNDGIDNSFGRNILPFILGIEGAAATKANEGLTKGQFTIMLSMEKLGAGNTYNPLVTRLYGGANLGKAPLFDGTDKWPVRPELLTDPVDIKTAKVIFKDSYLVGNTWVSGSKGNVDLELSISGFSLKLTIASALMTMNLDEAHKNATIGTIAGVIATETLITEIKKVAGAFNTAFCSGATIDQLTAQIEQASDILQDGSQDPTKTCDGISIGLGFDTSAVELGAIADPATPATDPCKTTP